MTAEGAVKPYWNIDILSVRQTGILPVFVADDEENSGLKGRWAHRLGSLCSA